MSECPLIKGTIGRLISSPGAELINIGRNTDIAFLADIGPIGRLLVKRFKTNVDM